MAKKDDVVFGDVRASHTTTASPRSNFMYPEHDLCRQALTVSVLPSDEIVAE